MESIVAVSVNFEWSGLDLFWTFSFCLLNSHLLFVPFQTHFGDKPKIQTNKAFSEFVFCWWHFPFTFRMTYSSTVADMTLVIVWSYFYLVIVKLHYYLITKVSSQRRQRVKVFLYGHRWRCCVKDKGQIKLDRTQMVMKVRCFSIMFWTKSVSVMKFWFWF